MIIQKWSKDELSLFYVLILNKIIKYKYTIKENKILTMYRNFNSSEKLGNITDCDYSEVFYYYHN
jgi:hypothetical protein